MSRSRKNYKYAWIGSCREECDRLTEKDKEIILSALRKVYKDVQIEIEPRKEGQKYSNIYLIIG